MQLHSFVSNDHFKSKKQFTYAILDWVLWNVGSNPQVQTACDAVAALMRVL